MTRKISVALPPLHSGQAAIVRSTARYRVLCCGRRWGKTMIGALLVLTAALTRKAPAWWIGPTYREARLGWRWLRRLAEQIPGTTTRLGDLTIDLPGGGRVEVRSAEHPERLRGEGLCFVALDEVASIRDWNEVWSQSLRPALSDLRGQAMFISTPRGFNHFYDLYQRGQDGEPDWESWQYPTWTNPYIDAEEIQDAKRELVSLIFRQEYGAEFVQLAGALIKRAWFNDAMIETRPERVTRWVRYWDLAVSEKTSADYTAGALVGWAPEGDIVIADMVHGRWEWPDARATIIATAKADGPNVTVGVESTGTQKGMWQSIMRDRDLARFTIRPVPSQRDKLVRASPWVARAEQGKVKLVRGEWVAGFLDEACAFPETEHDDRVDAVSGAMQMLGDASSIGVVVI